MTIEIVPWKHILKRGFSNIEGFFLECFLDGEFVISWYNIDPLYSTIDIDRVFHPIPQARDFSGISVKLQNSFIVAVFWNRKVMLFILFLFAE